jgi:hypothetical protein
VFATENTYDSGDRRHATLALTRRGEGTVCQHNCVTGEGIVGRGLWPPPSPYLETTLCGDF